MLAIEYLVHDDVTIRNYHGYWYIMKPMNSWGYHPKYSGEEILTLRTQGYDVWYWSDGWEPVAPRQFSTVEEALLAYETWRASEGKS